MEEEERKNEKDTET